MSKRGRRSVWAYRALLRLLPQRIQQEDGAEMVLAFKDLIDEARGPLHRLALTIYASARLLGVAAAEWRDLFRRSPSTSGSRIDSLRADVGFFLRSLRRDKGLAAMVVVITSLGVGATATVFSVIHVLAFKPPALR